MHILERLIKPFAPHTCLICTQEGGLLCESCASDALRPVPSTCYRCNKLSDNFLTCPTDRRRSRLKHVWITGQYDDFAKNLVHKLKFERAQAAATTMARLIAVNLPHVEHDLIVSVPTATSRVRKRGYDQAELLAVELARVRGVKHRPALARLRQSRQVGASKASREQQMQEAFRLRGTNYGLEGKRILLVDDVISTGATLQAAAQTLDTAGAKSIDAVVFAKHVR